MKTQIGFLKFPKWNKIDWTYRTSDTITRLDNGITSYLSPSAIQEVRRCCRLNQDWNWQQWITNKPTMCESMCRKTREQFDVQI